MKWLLGHLRMRRWPLLILLAALAIAIAGGWLKLRENRNPRPTPPDVQTPDLDSEVRAAIADARQKVEGNPNSAEAWGLLGKIYLMNGHGQQADVCFHQAETIDDKNPRWPYYLGIANLSTNTEEAIACLRRASACCDRYDTSVTIPHLQLATLLLQEGRNEEARKLLHAVRAKEPDSAHTLYLTALLQANCNDLRGSIALFRLLADNRAARQKVSTKLAQLHLRLGESQSAEKWDKLAQSLPEDIFWPDPYMVELQHYALGREQRFKEAERLQKQGLYGEAIELLKQMIERNESPLDKVYVALGNNLVHLAQGPEAEKAYVEALRLSPDNAETYTQLALVCLLQGEVRENRFKDRSGAISHYRRAETAARKAVSINPLLAEAHMTLGHILLYLGKRSEGIEELQTCLRARPELANAHFLLGEALAEEGRMDEARQHLLDAIRFASPGDSRPREALDRLEKKPGTKPSPP